MRPVVGVFVGDLHVGSDTAICKPNFPVGSKQKRPYIASIDQEWLYTNWQTFLSTIRKRTKGCLVFVGLGGDLVDGVNHHETTQTWGNHTDQRNMAVELLKPLVGMADHALGLLGTASHVGDQGDDDAAVCEALHVDSAHRWKVEIGNRLLLWAHHGVPVGRMDNTEESGAIGLVKSVQARYRRSGERMPDAIIGHDRHVTFEPPIIRGTSIAVCPCWQLPTHYGHRWPFHDVSIGGLIWDLSSNRIERVLYEKENGIKHIGA